MKKFLLYLLIIIFSYNPAVADGDLWDNFGDQNTYGQQAVTDKEFEQALESKKRKKKRDKNIPKGEEFSQSNETEIISKNSKEIPILMVPLDLKVDAVNIIPIGHYQVESEKKDNQIFLKFYQAHSLIAKIPAEETNDDFGEETINFVKLRDHGENHVEIIYGGLDFNAYTILEIK